AHISQAAAIEQVHNQLGLKQALEVGALGLIAGLDQRLKACLDERAHAAAEHRLLAKEIGLGLFLECGLQHSRARAADALQVTEDKRVCLASGILVNSNEAG